MITPLFPPTASPVPRAALFDLDGTLVRTFIDFPAMRTEMQVFSERMGTSAETAQTDDILEIVAVIAQTLGPDRGETTRREAYALLEAMEVDGCRHPERIDGASELLHRLRTERQVKIGIITRNCRRVSETCWPEWTCRTTFSSPARTTTEFKPHPAPILAACTHLGVHPGNTTMTGDLWADIASGRAAGVHATIGNPVAPRPRQTVSGNPRRFEVGSLQDVQGCLSVRSKPI
jgi:phosphoglycolate phosphatase